MPILYCRLCDKGYGSTGEIPERCPDCGRVTKWSTAPMREREASAIAWTADDRRFLRAFRIAST